MDVFRRGWSRQVVFEGLEGFFAFLRPLESLLQCFEKWEAFIGGFRDEPI